MDPMPTRGTPCDLPVAFHCWLPFPGLGTMPNTLVQYFYNKKAWMTGEVFTDALEELNARMKAENQKILLLLDNFSGHKWCKDNITNITVLFSPGLTSFVIALQQW